MIEVSGCENLDGVLEVLLSEGLDRLAILEKNNCNTRDKHGSGSLRSPQRALPTETIVQSKTSHSKSGTSSNV